MTTYEMTDPVSKPAWYSSLPQPIASPSSITPSELHEMMQNEKLVVGKDYLVIDVRRADMDEPGGNIIHPYAINFPAQTFHQSLPVTFTLLQHIPNVIFHCSSSNGRGPRCAGWYQDYADNMGIASTKASILIGGIKAWKDQYPELVKPL